MFNKRIVLVTFMISLVLCGCNKNKNKHIDIEEKPEEVIEVFTEEDSEEMFNERDYKEDYDKSNCVNIKIKDNKISSDKDAVRIKDNKAIIEEEGTYVVSGKIDDGMIVVNAKKKDNIQLVLKGADITSKTSAPIYVKQAKKVFVTLDKKSKNSLRNGGEFKKIDKNNVDGVIFSKADITINGEGTINVETTSGHGIVSKDDLVITNGNINVKVSEHGLTGNDSVRIDGGKLTLVSGKDGIHGNNEQRGHVYVGKGQLEINAKDDGIHASNNLIINNGKINVLDSYEGIEGKCIDIINGDINIVASDDGINVSGGKDKSGIKGPFSGKKDKFNTGEECYLNISGGKILVDAEGDGIDSNGSILVSGGETYISGPTKGGNGALDYGTGAQVTGGIFIATGVEGMAANFDENSVQGAMLITIDGKKKDVIQVLNNKNKVVFKWESKKQFQTVLISCPDVKQGEEYTIKVGKKKERVLMSKIVYGGEKNRGEPGGNHVGPGGDSNMKDKEKKNIKEEQGMYKIDPPRPRRGESN